MLVRYLVMGLAILWVGSGPVAAQGVDQRFVMALHVCEGAGAECRDPRNHRVYVAQSNNGRRWRVVPGWEPYQGSVPDIIRRGDALYVYTPQHVRRYRFDVQRWEDPVRLRLEDEGGQTRYGVDHTAVLENDRIVLTYLEGTPGRPPGRCAPGETRCTKRFWSATEVPGTDGQQFVEDPKPVLEVSIAAERDSATDPDLFVDHRSGRTVLYLSRGMKTEVYTSDGLRGPFVREGDLNEQGTGGVASGIVVGSRVWTYVTVRVPQGPEGVEQVRRARHRELAAGLTAWRFRPIRIDLWGRGAMASPSVSLNLDGLEEAASVQASSE